MYPMDKSVLLNLTICIRSIFTAQWIAADALAGTEKSS